MRKGFFASVAALATGAGVALGQGYPGVIPGSPAMPGAGPNGPPPSSSSFYGGGGAAYPAGPTDLPPAPEMPLNGPVAGPDAEHPMNPACAPKYGMQAGQIHKAAGGPDRWYLDLEDMIWTFRKMPLPYPLVTSGTPVSQGAFGVEGTSVAVGDNIDYGNTLNVGRLTVGIWDKQRVWGFEASGFLSETKAEHIEFTQPISSNTVLARPVIDALTGLPTALLVSFPNQFAGTVAVDAKIHIGGAEANIMRSCLYCDMAKFNTLVGIRYLQLDERLQIGSVTTIPTTDPNDPNISIIQDEFFTRNQFYGGQIGFQSELRCNRFFMDTTVKFAIGDMHEKSVVSGLTTRAVTGTLSTTPGGLLALGSNIGTTSKNEFAFVPEGTLKFGYQWTQRISTYLGVNALYLSRVVRPGDQIDPVVNPVFVPVSDRFGGNFGPAQPAPQFNHSDFWAVGGTMGLQIRY